MIASFARYWAPLLLYMGLVFWVSSRPRPEGVSAVPDVVLHGGAYFVMAILAIRAFGHGLAEPVSGATLWGGVAVAVLYGACDEWHQSFVPARVGDAYDVLFDALGAFLAGPTLSTFWSVRARQIESRGNIIYEESHEKRSTRITEKSQ